MKKIPVEVLKASPLFYTLRNRDLDWLSTRGKECKIKAFQSFKYSYPLNAFVNLIDQGQITAMRRSKDGEDFYFNLGTGATFGRLDSFLNLGSTIQMMTQTDSTIYSFDEQDIAALMMRSFEAQHHIEQLHQCTFPLIDAKTRSGILWEKIIHETTQMRGHEERRKHSRVDVCTWNFVFHSEEKSYRVKDFSANGLAIFHQGKLRELNRIEGTLSGNSQSPSAAFEIQGVIQRVDHDTAGIKLIHNTITKKVTWHKLVQSALRYSEKHTKKRSIKD